MIETPSIDSGNIAEYASHLLEASALFPREGLATHEFHLPFLDVTVAFSDVEFARICRSGLASCGASDSDLAMAVEILVMSAADGEWPEPANWREPSFSPVNFDRVITGHQLRGYYHHDHRFWQFYDPTSGRGIQSMSAAHRYPPWESSGPLRAFLHWAYDGLGMRLTHAATLGFNGRGVLLAGSGGSGKSGTTLAGISNGLNSVGDDYILMDRGPSYHAHTVFSKMKQDADGLKRVGISPSQLGDGAPNWQNKFEFDPKRIHGDALTDRMEIVGILLPRIAHCPRTTIEPARPAEAMMALAPSGLFQMPGCTVNGVRFFSEFVRHIPAFHLSLSENSADIADTIHGFLDKGGLARAG